MSNQDKNGYIGNIDNYLTYTVSLIFYAFYLLWAPVERATGGGYLSGEEYDEPNPTEMITSQNENTEVVRNAATEDVSEITTSRNEDAEVVRNAATEDVSEITMSRNEDVEVVRNAATEDVSGRLNIAMVVIERLQNVGVGYDPSSHTRNIMVQVDNEYLELDLLRIIGERASPAYGDAITIRYNEELRHFAVSIVTNSGKKYLLILADHDALQGDSTLDPENEVPPVETTGNNSDNDQSLSGLDTGYTADHE